MQEPLVLLKVSVNAVSPVSEESWTEFSRIWKPFHAGRKEVISGAGMQENYLYFVTGGVQRIYFPDDSGREATLVFVYAPSFGGIIDSLLLEKPSIYIYETLTPSQFLRASGSDLREVMHLYPDIERMIRTGITQTLSGIMERLMEVQSFSSEEKFRKLLKRSPHILQLVPHKYLANYLGMDATNFSKLLNRVKI
ncbi:Crp/Fnr family transcriptional regulator [Dyadobacter sediminis]|uniref:Crp/Fnr family transcriptional regulator n=2 Tax=Dyadobacter sediminis TaxID=1493691 RepID=A0A5R9KL53_9BACT|nr:Crp/Fnr family transcriptional regulator [Dyadobacter sediminis]